MLARAPSWTQACRWPHWWAGSFGRGRLAARRPIEDRIEQATRALARLTRTTALTGLVGNGEQLRASWDTLNLDRQHAIVKAVLDHAVIAPGRAGVHTVELERVAPVWRA